jgi:hypothetical protein
MLRTVDLADLEVRGLLAYRAGISFARLEGEWYRPHEVFRADRTGWPGDWEGRIILALTLMARATGREPAWLEEILARVPEYLNEKGFFGKVPPPGVANEQQLSGHSWFLRGLVEHHFRTGDANCRSMAEQVVENLLLPTRGLYAKYPITNEERLDSRTWELSHLQTKLKTHAKTKDTGCAFIMLDGATQAYELLRRDDLRGLIREMIARFVEMDFVDLGIQTHATLSALRGILRFYELEGEREHLEAARRIFELYKTEAWTENYSNYNWFGIPRWTEPCAIIDSFIVAVWLWRLTGEARYLEDAHHIYFNGIAHAHRASGAFGSARCLGSEHVFLRVTTYEVYWCCTMRGGEMWHKAFECALFRDDHELVLPFYHDLTATVRFSDGDVKVKEKTGYPYDGSVRLEVVESSAPGEKTIRLFAPSWTKREAVRVTVNGSEAQAEFVDGFLVLRMPLKKADAVELDLGIGLHVRDTISPHTPPGWHTFRHGPMILWCESPEIVRLGKDARLVHLGGGRYRAHDEEGPVLSPINDPYVLTQPGSSKQALFGPMPLPGLVKDPSRPWDT